MSLKWRPIETAPKDGSPILATGSYKEPSKDWSTDEYWPDGKWIYVIRWHKSNRSALDYWVEAGGEGWEEFKPTHWMPLSELPDAG